MTDYKRMFEMMCDEIDREEDKEREAIIKYMKIMNEVAEESKVDPETSHIRADEIMCDIMEEMGYVAVVEAYRRVRKWYA